MSGGVLTHVQLGDSWQQLNAGDRDVLLRCVRDGVDIQIGVRHSVDGRLRDAYPVSSHDVELYPVRAGQPPTSLTAALSELSRAILAADQRCRRIVFASPAEDRDTMSAALAAGFRYVLDVDVPSAELSLLVAEPGWVTAGDAGLDQIPDS
jgi:hypothetical protein